VERAISGRRRELLPLVFLLLVGTVLFGDVLVGRGQLYMRDLTRYYYPTKQILREIVLRGEFPYWNRYYSAGQPIAANPEHEVFYPLTWLILLPSYDLGYRLHILLHVYIGLLGMYALLRTMQLRRAAALFGALSFGIGGLFLSYINLLPILFCAAWIPLSCLFVRRFLLQRTLRNFALASLMFGVEFLVAEPTTVAQTGLLIGSYALYRAWREGSGRMLRSVRRVVAIGLVTAAALSVGAAQILPALDHVRDSARSRPFEFSLVSAWSLPPAKLAELVYPNILGHVAIDRVMWYWAGGLYPGMGSPFLFSIYVGIMAVALTVGGLFARLRGTTLLAVLCAMSLIFALGDHTPLLHWLYQAKLLTTIRYPEKFALLGVFAIIVYASQALDALLGGDDRVRDGALGFILATTMIAVILACFSFTPTYTRLFMKVWGIKDLSANTRFMVGLTRTDWIVASIRGIVVLTLLATAARFRQRRWWRSTLVLAAAVDLGYVTWELNPRMPRRFFDPPPMASTLPLNRAAYRIFHEADWYGSEEIARQYFSTGNAVYWVVRNGLFPMTPAGAGVRTVMERDYDKTALIPTVDLTDSIWDVKRAGRSDWAEIFMAMSNAWFRAEYRPFAEEKKRNGGDFNNSLPIRLAETVHNPRYYFADQMVTIRSRDEFVKDLTSRSYSRRAAFVTIPSFTPARGSVIGVREGANSATLDVDCQGESFLVMSVTPHKYWRAFIDDRAAPLRHVNIGYQGLVVTPGRHRIVMRYWNDDVRMGIAISIAAIGALALLTMLRGRTEASPLHQIAYEEPIHVDAHGEPIVAQPAGADEGLVPEPREPGGERVESNRGASPKLPASDLTGAAEPISPGECENESFSSGETN
jgi:hypothetical protein